MLISFDRHGSRDLSRTLSNFGEHDLIQSLTRRDSATLNPQEQNTRVIEYNERRGSFKIFNLPKRMLWWIYSISLVLLIILMLAFVAVTPIDVIVRTSGASYSGIKMFIVIIVCVVFFILSIVLYFVRIFHNRVALGDIPSKSVYIPGKGDMPKSVYNAINKRLKECLEIRERISPLENSKVIINHAGVSPPEYVQERNHSHTNEGTLLPPDSNYEDIIRSLGDNFRHGKFFTYQFPQTYSFKEIIVHLSELYAKSGMQLRKPINCHRIIELYEKFRYGPDLIEEKDMLEFMIEFERLTQLFQSHYGAPFTNEAQSDFQNPYPVLDRDNLAKTLNDQERSSWQSQTPYHGIHFRQPFAQSKQLSIGIPADTQSSTSVIRPTISKRSYSEESPYWYSSGLNVMYRKLSSASSSKSVIRSRPRRKSSAVSSSFPNMAYSGEADLFRRRNSGYVTDSENEDDSDSSDFENDDDDDDDDDDDNDDEDDDDDDEEDEDLKVYSFRRMP
ncbi:uncharacterized protein PRCAT00000648001 [Priceomyces carsonii]|uniref:uncharacterized protein n=1 Tax=Priceomyces carsonii TaxID=28549 RepID=UPI002ED97A2E|nr:unnamed protein product [Priceomyces carsonii]